MSALFLVWLPYLLLQQSGRYGEGYPSPWPAKASSLTGDAMKSDVRMTIAAVILMLLILLPVIWVISTEEQRDEYRAWLGLADAYDAVEEEIPASPREFVAIEASRPQTMVLRHGDVSACNAAKVANPASLRKGDVYRWTDQKGQVHFSDRPADTETALGSETVPVTGRARFSATCHFDGLRPPALLKEELERHIDGVFRFFEHTLRLHDMAPLQVNLRVIEGRKRFAGYRNKKSPGLTTDSGFYRFHDNEAVVRWTDKAHAVAVAQHEVSHLVVGNLLGDTPLWVNEGLAEVAERLSFSGSGMLAEPDPEAMRALRSRSNARGWPSLREFIRLARSDWDDRGETFSYQYAWSLLHFLLEDSDRRDLLADYVRALAGQRCKSFDTAGYFERHYPGGLDAFENDWRDWLAIGRPKALAL